MKAGDYVYLKDNDGIVMGQIDEVFSSESFNLKVLILCDANNNYHTPTKRSFNFY